MKKLIAVALLVVLSGVSSIARAELTRGSPTEVAQARAERPAQTTSLAPTAEGSDYASREAAAPALGDFRGGDAGIYIGGGALSVLVIVLLIVLLV
jgi:hypothetical protein